MATLGERVKNTLPCPKYPAIFIFAFAGMTTRNQVSIITEARCAPCPGGGMVDARDLKSLGLFARAGSSPAPGTNKKIKN